MFDYISLLSSSQSTSTPADSIIMAVISAIGAILLLCFSLPLFFVTIKTKDTSQLSWLMWGIYVGATFTLGLSSMYNSISALVLGGDDTTKINMIPLLLIGIANVISLTSATTMLILKAINVKNAKKQGLNELEYCRLNNPSLKKEAKVIEEISLEQEANTKI